MKSTRAEERPDLADGMDRYAPRHKWLPGREHRGYCCNGDVDAFGDESLYKPSQLGQASVKPAAVHAGASGPLELTYVAGPSGLPRGSTITFVIRGQDPLGAHSPVPARVDGPGGCGLEVTGPHQVRIARGTLREGDFVTLRYAPFEWTPLAGRREFKVVIDSRDGRVERRLPEPLVVEVLPLSLDRLQPMLPCTRRPRAAVGVRVTARDRYDNRVAIGGHVRIHLGGAEETVCMSGGLADCRLLPPQDGVLRARAVAPGGLTSRSNPCVPSRDLQFYVGDLHCHDFLSEAEGYPDAVYRWAIEDRRLDFVSVVPQTHGWHDNETWTVTKYMNERYLDEGRFVTFLGFEWQHVEYGDKVVHYLGGDQPYLPKDDPRYSMPAKLYAALRASDAVVIGHHPCYPAGDWCSSTDYDAVETDVERLIELWSMHGSSEGYEAADRPLIAMDRTRTVTAALLRGLRVGFVAGSDTHSARPGGSAKEPRPYWGGLAAVWAESLTRRDLFAALRSRRTVALTGARIVLRMTVNGAEMGSEIALAHEAEIRIHVWAPDSIRMVEIMRDARSLKQYGPYGDECHLTHVDRPHHPAFYYCRVTQADGHLAVCSPVWLG